MSQKRIPFKNIQADWMLSLPERISKGEEGDLFSLHLIFFFLFFFFPNRENVMEDIHSKLQEIRNPIHAIGVLIREMDYETDTDMERGESSTAVLWAGEVAAQPAFLLGWFLPLPP